jgi:hypothetical protein
VHIPDFIEIIGCVMRSGFVKGHDFLVVPHPQKPPGLQPLRNSRFTATKPDFIEIIGCVMLSAANPSHQIANFRVGG